MNTKVLWLSACLALTGCIVPHHGVVVPVPPPPPFWDGHTFVTVTDHTHCDGCGHYYYDGVWNLYPRTYVYTRPGYRRYGHTGHFRKG